MPSAILSITPRQKLKTSHMTGLTKSSLFIRGHEYPFKRSSSVSGKAAAGATAGNSAPVKWTLRSSVADPATKPATRGFRTGLVLNLQLATLGDGQASPGSARRFAGSRSRRDRPSGRQPPPGGATPPGAKGHGLMVRRRAAPTGPVLTRPGQALSARFARKIDAPRKKTSQK
jgi:hypothetical protein